jgi:protein-S-isoprenylcysteine O-methyltransferase Ste14
LQHRGHENLTGEHNTGDLGQLIILILFAGLWFSDMFLKYSIFINEYIPLWVKLPVGIILLMIAAYLAKTGMTTVFGKNAQAVGVIRNGIFRFVRHPIYLSEIIFYLGLLIINLSLAATLVWVAGILFLHFISRFEEKLLLERYGEEYRQYMKEVPMWIPYFRNQKRL